MAQQAGQAFDRCSTKPSQGKSGRFTAFLITRDQNFQKLFQMLSFHRHPLSA
jgi:hypothetical protein